MRNPIRDRRYLQCNLWVTAENRGAFWPILKVEPPGGSPSWSSRLLQKGICHAECYMGLRPTNLGENRV